MPEKRTLTPDFLNKMATASSPLNAIEKELECSICCDTMKSPKIVGKCYHAFCRGCIEEYVKSQNAFRWFLCPQCRSKCPLSAKGVKGLKNDFRAAALISSIQEAKRNVSATRRNTGACNRDCHFCGLKGMNMTKNKAEFICDVCELELCRGCKNDHSNKTEDSVEHYVYQICSGHELRMKHFCADCEMVICIRCWTDEHNTCCPPVLYKDIANYSLIERITKQCEQASEYGLKMNSKVNEIEDHAADVKEAAVKFRHNVLVESKAKVGTLECEISNIKRQLEGLQSRLEKLETEKVELEETEWVRLDEVETYCGDYVSAVQSIRKEYSATLEKLEEAKCTIQRLGQDRCLGPQHHEGVVQCEGVVESILSYLDHLDESIYKIGTRQLPKYEVGTSDQCKLTSFFSKLDFM